MYRKSMVFAFLLLITACISKNATSQALPEVHLPINNPNIKFLWSRYYQFASTLTEAPDHIIGLRFTTITSFDSLSGNIIWERTGDYPTELIQNNSVLYETTYDRLTAFDALSGNLIWDRNNLKTGNAQSLLADSGNIFIQHQTGSPIIVLDKAGNFIRTLDVSTSIEPLSIDANILYYIDIDGLHGFDIDKNQTLWSVNIKSATSLDSVSTANIFYIDSVTPTSEDTIIAVDKTTQTIIWTWDKFTNIISNLCVLDDNIYFLTADGFLIGLNKSNGREALKLEFSNRPFTLYRSEEPQVGKYHIVADSKNKVLAMALGDSFQLMAIQLLDP